MPLGRELFKEFDLLDLRVTGDDDTHTVGGSTCSAGPGPGSPPGSTGRTGLAPAPVEAALESGPPVIVMSRLPGQVIIRGINATGEQITAITATLKRLPQPLPGASHTVGRRGVHRPASA
ncbi:hypothetical protein ACNF49_30585 [Actinomadura sp. ATCC 39365]